MTTIFKSEVDRYMAKGFQVSVAVPGGVTMVKPKRVSVVWMLGTGVLPYLIYHILFKAERSVFVPHDGLSQGMQHDREAR